MDEKAERGNNWHVPYTSGVYMYVTNMICISISVFLGVWMFGRV